MRPISRATILAATALCCATGALAQEAAEESGRDGLDWSVGLRGSYAANSLTGGQPGLEVTPEISLTLNGESSQTTLAAGSELVVNGAGSTRISDLHTGLTTSLRIGATTTLGGSITGSLTQAEPTASGLPANTLIAPLALDGAVQGSVTQDMGRVDATLTIDGARRILGETTLDDLTTVDNANRSYWDTGATLRLGYELTPTLTAFVEGEARLQKFDAADPTVLKYLDGREYQLRSGLSFTRGSVISAEASIGRGWLDYLDGTLIDTQSWVYNGTLTYRPDPTVTLTSALETTLDPSESTPGDTDVGITLTAGARYAVNSLLTLRTSGGWDRTVTLGTGASSWGLDAGLGLDYRRSRHVVWSVDYAYARDHAPPTPVNDTHTVSVGVRVQR